MLPWQPIFGKIAYQLSLFAQHSEMEWNIATTMCKLTVPVSFYIMEKFGEFWSSNSTVDRADL